MEKIIFSWTAPERPFKVRNREFYSTVMVLGILVGIIFFFIEDKMTVLMTAAILFVIFAISRTSPADTNYSVTSLGLNIGTEKYRWDEITVFWLEEKSGNTLLRGFTTRRWPNQLVLVLPKNGTPLPEELKKIVSKHVRFEKPADTHIDKFIHWFSQKVPLE